MSEPGAVISSEFQGYHEMPIVLASNYARVMSTVWPELTLAERKKMLHAVEMNVSGGNQYVKEIWTTGFPEALCAELDTEKLSQDELLPCLGDNSVAYMNAWNRFNGLQPFLKH